MKTGSKFIISNNLLEQISGGGDPNGPADLSGINGNVGKNIYGDYVVAVQVGVAPNIAVGANVTGNYAQHINGGGIFLKIGM